MITIEEAAEIVATAVNKNYFEADDVMVVIPEATIHTSYGWVFFWNSKRYRESKDPDYLLAGNSPILVLAKNGATVSLGTCRPTEELLMKWESQHPWICGGPRRGWFKTFVDRILGRYCKGCSGCSGPGNSRYPEEHP